MKIAIVQTKPVRGDIPKNIAHHRRLLDLAASRDAEFTVFPELSLTGYEPELAGDLATDQEDARLDAFQAICDSRGMTIAAGLPTRNSPRPCISLIIFQPHRKRQTYSKRFLHPDEEPFFVQGTEHDGLIAASEKVALAICYEISVPQHAEAAFQKGAQVYLASVAKTASGIVGAAERLSKLARRHSAPVLMANCVGLCGGYDCAGGSAVWRKDGTLAGHLGGAHEGLIVFDTQTQEAAVLRIEDSIPCP
jgi:predicted amidohydrolase